MGNAAILSVALLALSTQTFADAGEKILVRMEAHAPNGRVQSQALLLSNGKFTTTRNTNAHCDLTAVAHLGRFDSDAHNLPAVVEKMHQISLMASNAAYTDLIPSPHDTKYYRGKEDVTLQPFLRKAIGEVILSQCDTANWSHTDTRGLEIILVKGRLEVRKYKNGKPVSKTTQPLSRAGCLAQEDKVICAIKEFGELLFVMPSPNDTTAPKKSRGG